ncbi:hypothetical protein T06_16397 [Trichinella sp. T6]|nr:hypothetical protein T06_16397 [Trichinella sp. T6]
MLQLNESFTSSDSFVGLNRCQQQQSIFIVSFRSSFFLPTIFSSGCNLPETSIWTVQLAGDANQSKTDEPFQMVQNHFSVSRQGTDNFFQSYFFWNIDNSNMLILIA